MSLLKRLGGQPSPSESASVSAPVAAPTIQPVAPPTSEQRPSLLDAVGGSASSGGGLAEKAGLRTTEDTPTNGNTQKMLELSLWVVDRIQASLGTQADLKRTPETERLLQERFATYYRQANVGLPDSGVKQLYTMVVDELLGFGPIQRLLEDPDIS